MKKIFASIAVAVALGLFAQAGNAAFTLYDLARDSMYVVRGEFISLERTNVGDRLTLRCDTLIKNWQGAMLAQVDEVVLEPFEHHKADAALGRDVLVGFNLMDGKYYFNMTPYAWRSFCFEETDQAPNGLDRNEEALRRFVDINRPHQAVIEAEMRKRLQYQTLAYEGEFKKELIDEWKAELLVQMSWAGTVAARDAAKSFVDHKVFRNTLTVDELRKVGSLLKASLPGSLERSWMLEIVRNEFSAHPDFSTLLAMLREETADYCVGKLSNLFTPVQDREAVLAAIGAMAVNREESTQVRVNALQTLAALADKASLSYLHQVLTAEQELGANQENYCKDAVRGALKALRKIPDTSSESALENYMASEQCQASWELTRRAWIAYSIIASERSNKVLSMAVDTEKATTPRRKGRLQFLARLMPATDGTTITRELIMVHNED